MKLSHCTSEMIAAMSVEDVATIAYGGCRDDGESADVALLLGSSPINCLERAECAAALYRCGRVRAIIPSGGVEWEVDGEAVSEAMLMTRILMENGVPEEAIIVESEAQNTAENMIYGSLQITRRVGIQNIKSVCVVTSASHLRRSMELARLFMPRWIRLSGCPANVPCDIPTALQGDERLLRLARLEVTLLKGLIDFGLIGDIEY